MGSAAPHTCVCSGTMRFGLRARTVPRGTGLLGPRRLGFGIKQDAPTGPIQICMQAKWRASQRLEGAQTGHSVAAKSSREFQIDEPLDEDQDESGSFRSMNHLTRRFSSSGDYHGHKLLAAKGADCRVVSHTAPATIGRDTFDQAKSCELQALKSRRRARQEVQRARDARSTAHAVQLVGMLSAFAPESSARNTAERMECGTHTRVCLGPPFHCTARV